MMVAAPCPLLYATMLLFGLRARLESLGHTDAGCNRAIIASASSLLSDSLAMLLLCRGARNVFLDVDSLPVGQKFDTKESRYTSQLGGQSLRAQPQAAPGCRSRRS